VDPGRDAMDIRNLFIDLRNVPSEETIETLLEDRDFILERIVSTGQSTPDGAWYDQDRDEWVILLTGGAGLSFEGEDEVKVLIPGDYLLIPARKRHRVEWTDKRVPTVWLALHYRPK
jgi:cupin 2 domain-containing protein